ncbi:MAG: SHOCT domain-containing protein [Nitrosopumilus sp.]
MNSTLILNQKKSRMTLLDKKYWTYSLLVLFSGLLVNPAFGELTSFHTNNNSFMMGDEIEFSGTVEKESRGLVTIVIRDQNNEFVLLTQATINPDDTFEKSIVIENKFTESGTYNATGFILNMTRGITSEFDVSLNESKVIIEPIVETVESEIDNTQQNNHLETEKNNESIEKPKIINRDFVDANKDPSYYIQRYYSEPEYKSWFDRNYPGQTIEETVGYTDNVEKIKSRVQDIMDKEILPQAQASSIAESTQNEVNNSEIAQTSLVLAAIGILFGAVYGVKRQADSNSRQILINRNSIRIPKISNPITGSNPNEILQKRLTKGEITLEEYERLKSKID